MRTNVSTLTFRPSTMIPAGTALRRSARLNKLIASSHQGDGTEQVSDLSATLLKAIRSKPQAKRKRRAADPEPEPALGSTEPVSEDVEAGDAEATVPLREMEEELWRQGYSLVAGVDEAGRGPLAGPVVAGACIIPQDVRIVGIDDSKKLTAARREAVYRVLVEHPRIVCATAVVDAAQIDDINILQATLLAMEKAVAGLQGKQPDFILIDGNQLPKGLESARCRTVVKGDSRSHVIAAASILAKVHRDKLMDGYDKLHPQYGFKEHKGYGTVKHMAALRLHGPCDIHRRSYRPVAEAEAMKRS